MLWHHHHILPTCLELEASLVRHKTHASPVSLERYWQEDKAAWKKFQCYLKSQKIENVL